MQNYKDINDQVHVLDSADFEYLLPAGCVKITQEEADAIVNPPPITAQLRILNEVAIQAALDEMAQSRGYADIKSACAYAASIPAVSSSNANFSTCEKFRLEGNALQSWMSLTWATAYAYLATVTAGTNPMPTPAQVVVMIPAFAWPD